MKHITDTFTLSNGTKMPCVGFGTWQTPDGQVAENAVYWALKAGYRHIDTAAAYENEVSVGAGIKRAGLAREDIFITTKLANPNHDYDLAKAACKESLEKLGLDYLDLYLIHWPNPVHVRDRFEETITATWRAMEELYDEGKTKAIGISNFLPHHTDVIKAMAKTMPMVNQILIYPGYLDAETIQYCRQNSIVLQAYSPLGTGRLLKAPELAEMAAKYGVTVAQLCLRWCLQMDFCPLPKSVTESRIIENADLFDFEITKEDLDTLSYMKDYGVQEYHPDTAPF